MHIPTCMETKQTIRQQQKAFGNSESDDKLQAHRPSGMVLNLLPKSVRSNCKFSVKKAPLRNSSCSAQPQENANKLSWKEWGRILICLVLVFVLNLEIQIFTRQKWLKLWDVNTCCFCIRRINRLELVCFSQLYYRFNVFLIKLPVIFHWEFTKRILKINLQEVNWRR